jgi:hypothetical protein
MTTPMNKEGEAFLHLEVAPLVPYDRVVDAETFFLRLLRAVSEAVAGQARRVEWQFVTAESNGVVSLRVTPTAVADDEAVAIVDAIATGMAALEHAARRPEHFSDDALEYARSLAALSGELRQLGVRNGHVAAAVTNNVADHAALLLAPAFEEFGSIEGSVEAVNFHAKNRYFNLYDRIDGHRIRCNFGGRVDTDAIRDALLRRVLVSGLIGYKAAGVATQIQVESLSVFPDEEQLPTPAQVRGILG